LKEKADKEEQVRLILLEEEAKRKADKEEQRNKEAENLKI